MIIASQGHEAVICHPEQRMSPLYCLPKTQDRNLHARLAIDFRTDHKLSVRTNPSAVHSGVVVWTLSPLTTSGVRYTRSVSRMWAYGRYQKLLEENFAGDKNVAHMITSRVLQGALVDQTTFSRNRVPGSNRRHISISATR